MTSFALFRDAAQDGQTAKGELLLVERLVCRECGKETRKRGTSALQ